MRLAFAPLLLLLVGLRHDGRRRPHRRARQRRRHPAHTRTTATWSRSTASPASCAWSRSPRSRGPTYYLVDSNGDGTLDSSKGEGPISPVQYKLFEW